MAAASLQSEVVILCAITSFHSHWHYLSSAHLHLFTQWLQVTWSSCMHFKPLQVVPKYACLQCSPGHVTPLLNTHQWLLNVFRYLSATNMYQCLQPLGDTKGDPVPALAWQRGPRSPDSNFPIHPHLFHPTLPTLYSQCTQPWLVSLLCPFAHDAVTAWTFFPSPLPWPASVYSQVCSSGITLP